MLLIEGEHAEKDYWYELLQKRMPYVKNLQHQIVPGGHHLHLDNPEPIAMAIREFLNKISEKT